MREAHAAVQGAGALASTYFVYTSDHGLHMGQRRLGACKRTPYDTDVRIPFYIAGCPPPPEPRHIYPSPPPTPHLPLRRRPGIAPGSRFDFMASMVDVAPTHVDLSGATAAAKKRGLVFDGRSMAPLLLGAEEGRSAPWRDAVLVSDRGIQISRQNHARVAAAWRLLHNRWSFTRRRRRAR